MVAGVVRLIQEFTESESPLRVAGSLGEPTERVERRHEIHAVVIAECVLEAHLSERRGTFRIVRARGVTPDRAISAVPGGVTMTGTAFVPSLVRLEALYELVNWPCCMWGVRAAGKHRWTPFLA